MLREQDSLQENAKEEKGTSDASTVSPFKESIQITSHDHECLLPSVTLHTFNVSYKTYFLAITLKVEERLTPEKYLEKDNLPFSHIAFCGIIVTQSLLTLY